jgi:membrane-bound lytic murein transglycosylase B
MTHPLLQPQPLTREQIADLVERTRIADRLSRAAGYAKYCEAMGGKKRRRPGDKTVIAAARFAYEHRTNLSDAAQKFGVAESTIGNAWRRMYPGVPALVARRTL